jgi:hypothetical protein
MRALQTSGMDGLLEGHEFFGDGPPQVGKVDFSTRDRVMNVEDSGGVVR